MRVATAFTIAVAAGALNNCTVYFNPAPTWSNYDSYTVLNYCCPTPMPTNGVGNITNAPLLVEYAAGKFEPAIKLLVYQRRQQRLRPDRS